MVMKNIITWHRLYFLAVSMLLISGCASLVRDSGKNFATGFNQRADTLSRTVIKGITEQLSDPATKKRVIGLLDSIVVSLDNTIEPRVQGMMGNVLNHKVLLWSDSLVEVLSGKHLRLNMRALQYEMVGRTKEDILQIRNSFKAFLDDMLSDNTVQKFGKFRDEMLGPKTDSAISRIVDHATAKVINQINYRLNPTFKQDVSYLGKYGAYFLAGTGAIAVIIILVVWWSKRRYANMVTLLAKHIHNIPDQKVYDKVTGRIKDEAISTGLEPYLRKILTANGLIGKSNWNNKEKD
jgi:hypothetical protein